MQTTVQSKRSTRRSHRGIETLEQRIAPAGVFRWTATGGGAWNNPNNWQVVLGDLSDIADGFPKDAGDTAELTNAITANATINIPNNVEIALGKLIIDDNNNYTITASGSGRLVLNGGADDAAIQISASNGFGNHTIQAPIRLDSSVSINSSSPQPFVIQTGITASDDLAGITKRGSGELILAGAGANTYSGNTTVEQGTLRLNKNDGFSAIGSGTLILGSFSDGAGSATAILGATEQISDNRAVVVYGNGEFNLAGFTETVSQIFLYDSANVATGAGTLKTDRVSADVFHGATGGTISGNLELTGSRNIDVGDTVPGSKLEISAVIKGSGGLRKDGAGILELTTTAPQQYTGSTLVAEGTLAVNTTTSDRGVSDSITISSGATMRILRSFEVPDTTSLSILGGTLEVAATEDILNLTMSSGTISIAGGQDFRIQSGGTVTVPTSATAEGSVITGAGRFVINTGDVLFSIGETPGKDALTVITRMGGIDASAGLVKSGPGRLVLTADGTFDGGITLQEGTLVIGGEHDSAVEITGGTLTRNPTNFFPASVAGISGNGGRVMSGISFASSGNLNLSAGLTFAPTFTSGAFRMDVTGTVSLGNATLDLTPLSPSSSVVPTVLIDNDGSDAVMGTFLDLPEGAKVKTPRGNYQISYVGGDGNDVTLTAVLVEPTILPGGKVATFTDVDGDLVRVSISKGTLTPANFKLLEAGLGARFLNFGLQDASFAGTNLTINATPVGGLGSRSVDVQFLFSSVDVGNITLAGDAGSFSFGAAGNSTPAFKSFTLHSVGHSNQIESSGSSYGSQISGGFGSLKVKGNVVASSLQFDIGMEKARSIAIGGSILPGDGNGICSFSITGSVGKLAVLGDVVGNLTGPSIRVSGSVGQLSIGGSIVGGAGFASGQVRVEASEANATFRVGGSLVGGSGPGSGTLAITGSAALVKIGGSLLGDDGLGSGRLSTSGDLASLLIGGDTRGGDGSSSGTIAVGGFLKTGRIAGSMIGGVDTVHEFLRIGTLSIGRDISGSVTERVTVSASGIADPANSAAAQVIGSILVGRNVQHTDILAGFDGTSISPFTADAQIGKVAVKGDWSASNLVAGVRAVDGRFGNVDDAPISGGSPDIASRIASIVIGGSVRGTVNLGDSFGFVAQEIGAMTVAGKKLPLSSSNKDVTAFGTYSDAFLREV